MKNIYKILGCAFALSAALSCSDLNETPVFDAAESFVAFDKAAVSVAENGGTVSIPVSVASIDPVAVTVVYEVVDSVSTAVQGKNFNLAEASATLVFDGQTRNGNIVVNVVDNPGVFTGDLTFTVSLLSAGNLKLGANNTCTVTITDLDHPLSDILGTYTVKGESYFNGPATWEAEFTKDATDITKVWMRGLAPGFAYDTDLIYGTVSEDHNTITIPIGQTLPYNSTYNAYFYAADMNQGMIFDETEVPTIALTRSDASQPFTSVDFGWSFYAVTISTGAGAGNFDIIVNGVTFTKN